MPPSKQSKWNTFVASLVITYNGRMSTRYSKRTLRKFHNVTLLSLLIIGAILMIWSFTGPSDRCTTAAIFQKCFGGGFLVWYGPLMFILILLGMMIGNMKDSEDRNKS